MRKIVRVVMKGNIVCEKSMVNIVNEYYRQTGENMVGLTLGIPLGVMYLSMKVYQVITNKYITKNKILIFFGVVGIAFLVAQIVPPRGWDLYQHYDEIDRFREWGAMYAWKKSRYVNYFGATLLFYMASLTPWDGTLPFITILVEGLVFEKITAYYKDKIGAQSAGICFFLFIALSNIVMAISGIRNVLAVTLINYAIWDFECVRKKNWIIDIAIAVFAITVHPASGFSAVIYGITYIPLRIIGVTVSIFILPVLTDFLNGFTTSKNAIISSSAGLFDLYTKEQAGLDIRVKIVSVILIVFSIIVALQIYWFKEKKDRYLYFIILYSIGTLGMITQGLVYSRMLYGMNVLYPILIMHYGSDGHDIRNIKSAYWYKVYCIVYCVGMLSFQGYELARAIFIK